MILKELEGKKKNYRDVKILSCVLLRVFATSLFLLPSIILVALLLPLRFLNPWFRKLGIQNSQLPSDLVQMYWARSIVYLMGMTVSIEGRENLSNDEPLVLMYSHASSLDPFFLGGFSPVATKFLFKKSLLWTAFYLFPIAWLYGHIPIDRGNREKAIASIEEAGNKIKKYKRSVCISPEGTRSPTGELLEFKKGPFHLSLKSGVSIVPVVLFNNYELWPKDQLFPLSGEVRMRFLAKIEPKDNDTVESLSDRVRGVMLEELKKKPEIKETSEKIAPAIIWLIILTVGIVYFLNF